MVYRDNWRTPDFDVYPQITVMLTLPDNDDIKRALFGSLYLLAQTYNWDEVGTGTPEQLAQTFADMIDNAQFGGALLPLLAVYPTMGGTSTIPIGHELCNGVVYTEEEYPEAYLRFQGSGKDTVNHTFQVPNLTGRVIRGIETAYPIGSAGGSDTHTLTLSEIPSHNHSEVASSAVIINGGLEAPANASVPVATVTGNAGGGASHNNMQRFFAIRHYIILSQ